MAGLKWDTACLQDTLAPTLGRAEGDFITRVEPVLGAFVPPVNAVRPLKEVKINKSADFECLRIQESELDGGAH